MIEPILKALNKFNITYCILHGWQSLPEDLSSDLDIIIVPDNLSALEKALSSCDGAKIIQLLQHETTGYYFVLAVRNGDAISFIPIDVATDYRLKGRIFFTADELLAGRRRSKYFWVSSPQVEFNYLLVKKIMKGYIPEHQEKRTTKLAHELGNEAHSIVVSLFGHTTGNTVIPLIQDGNWDILKKNFSKLRKVLLRQICKRDPLNPIRYRIPELNRLWQRLTHPTGLFIAVLGPDGAGKSTFIRNLGESLPIVFRKMDTFHLRPGIMGRKNSKGPVTDPHGKPPRSLFFSLLKILYFLLDYGLGYLLKVRPKLSRSTLVLFDRYYDDLLVDPLRYRYGRPLSLVRFTRRFIPKPDLFLVLDVPVETLMDRKQEVSLSELKRQRDGYRKLALELPNAVILDGSLPIKEVTRNGIEASMNYLRKRYQERHRLWFRDTKSESLAWLSSVLFHSPKKMHFVLTNSAGYNNEVQHKTETFELLPFKDGRGYLIPTSSRRVALSALNLYNPQHRKARLAKNILAVGLRAGVAGPFLQGVRLAVQSDVTASDRGRISLPDHIMEVLAEKQLSFAVSSGTPGQHRKPVIQALARNGKIIGYIKVGWNKATNALVRNEAEMLTRLSGVNFNLLIIPSMIYAGWWNARFICIQSVPEGETESAPRKLTPLYTAVLKEMKAFHTCLLPLNESSFKVRFSQKMEHIRSTYYRSVLTRGIHLVEKRLGNLPLPFQFCHGDFTPWNASLHNGKLYLFDWEYSNFEWLPGWDLFHFLLQTETLIRNRSPQEVYLKLRKSEIKELWIAEFSDNRCPEKQIFSSLFLLYLLERLAFYASGDDENLYVIKNLIKLIELFILEEESTQWQVV